MPIFATQSREQLRHAYLDAWQRARTGQLLSPLDRQIATVVEQHPEYHRWLERGDAALVEDFEPERGAINPFLHLGMHLAIREQVGTDRPAGIRGIHAGLTLREGDLLVAEHHMMEALGEALWTAQRSGTEPDEQAYLERRRRLL